MYRRHNIHIYSIDTPNIKIYSIVARYNQLYSMNSSCTTPCSCVAIPAIAPAMVSTKVSPKTIHSASTCTTSDMAYVNAPTHRSQKYNSQSCVSPECLATPYESMFAPLTLNDRDAIDRLFLSAPQLISEYSFTGLFCFAQLHQYSYCVIDKHLVIRGRDNETPYLILPHGCGLTAGSQRMQTMVRYFLQKGYGLKAVSLRYRDELRTFLAGQQYILEADLNDFDYIHKRSALADLAGTRFHKKRNHIHYFLKNNTIACYALGSEHIPHAYALLDRWEQQHQGKTDYQETLHFLEYYDRLPLCGIICYADTRAVGFAIGELRLDDKVCVVHMEKSDLSVRGSAQYINQRFAQSLPPQCRLINREQDLGNSGLRKAKQSYHPDALLPKYRISPFVWTD